jgi:hypothetical protein
MGDIERNKAVIRRWVEVTNAYDLDGLTGLFTPDTFDNVEGVARSAVVARGLRVAPCDAAGLDGTATISAPPPGHALTGVGRCCPFSSR